MADTSTLSKPLSLKNLNSASQLTDKLDGLKRSRANLETQWKLNLAFYQGRQYTYFNKTTNRLSSLPVDDGDKPRYRVRLVSNQIMTGAHSLLSKFTKTKPVITASPQSSSDADIKTAQLSEKLLQYWWREFRLDDKLEEAILWTIISGQGYWKIEWDPHANKSMRFLLDPNGRPITDEELKTIFTAELQKQGVEPMEKVVYLGDIKVSVPSPFDVFLDPSAKVFEDAKWAFANNYLSLDEAQSRYNTELQPDAVNSDPASVYPNTGSTNDKEQPNLVCVSEFFVLPNPAVPNGRYVVFTKDKILEDKSWPFPHQLLPFVKFPGLRVPGSIYDSSVVEHAIPLQKELNKTLSQIVEYKNLTVKPRVWAPTGSLTGQRITSEPGAVFEFNPIGDHRPEIEKMPAMQAYVFEHLNTIRQSLKEVFGLTEVTEGSVPPNVEAGVAIDLLQEMATDRLAPTIKLIETALGRAGNIMLQLAQSFYIEPRTLSIAGPGGQSRVQKFSKADLAGGVSVVVESGSALPRTRAGRQARIMEYLERGVIRPEQAYKYLDIADLEGVAASFRADEDQAQREYEKILKGEIINMIAYQDAYQAVMSGQVPSQADPQQPMTDQNEIQSYLHKQGLQPMPFENFQAHLDSHALQMKSVEFEALPPEVQRDLIDHYNATLDTLRSLPPQVEFQAVRPSLQIKATAGPTAVADILNKSGVMVTPQDMSEPPLDTWVSDSVDKPDADAAGPGQEANNLSEAAKIMLQSVQADAAAKAKSVMDSQAHQQNLAGSQMKQAQQVTQAANADARAEELHQAQLRKANAEADLAAKKAKQSDFKPKPAGGSSGSKAKG